MIPRIEPILETPTRPERRRPSRWLALDYDHIGWSAWALPHLLPTDPYVGISPPELQTELRRRLGLLTGPQLQGTKGVG